MSNYDVFVDQEAAEGAWKTKKNEWHKYLVGKYSKKVVKSTAKAVVSHFTCSIGGAIFEIPAAVSTYRHIANLDKILISESYKCNCNEINCAIRIAYAISQKKKKSGHVKRAMVPVLGTFDALKSKVHALTKSYSGNRGRERELQAKGLHNAARNGCPMAFATIAELLGDYKRQKSWQIMFAVRDWDEGWKVLKSKLAST